MCDTNGGSVGPSDDTLGSPFNPRPASRRFQAFSNIQGSQQPNIEVNDHRIIRSTLRPAVGSRAPLALVDHNAQKPQKQKLFTVGSSMHGLHKISDVRYMKSDPEEERSSYAHHEEEDFEDYELQSNSSKKDIVCGDLPVKLARTKSDCVVLGGEYPPFSDTFSSATAQAYVNRHRNRAVLQSYPASEYKTLDQNRSYYAKLLYDSVIDKTCVVDFGNNSGTRQFITGTLYDPLDIEARCHQVLDGIIDLYKNGTTMRTYEEAPLLAEDLTDNVRTRFVNICVLLKRYKAACIDLLHGKLNMIVNGPATETRRKGLNKEANARRKRKYDQLKGMKRERSDTCSPLLGIEANVLPDDSDTMQIPAGYAPTHKVGAHTSARPVMEHCQDLTVPYPLSPFEQARIVAAYSSHPALNYHKKGGASGKMARSTSPMRSMTSNLYRGPANRSAPTYYTGSGEGLSQYQFPPQSNYRAVTGNDIGSLRGRPTTAPTRFFESGFHGSINGTPLNSRADEANNIADGESNDLEAISGLN